MMLVGYSFFSLVLLWTVVQQRVLSSDPDLCDTCIVKEQRNPRSTASSIAKAAPSPTRDVVAPTSLPVSHPNATPSKTPTAKTAAPLANIPMPPVKAPSPVVKTSVPLATTPTSAPFHPSLVPKPSSAPLKPIPQPTTSPISLTLLTRKPSAPISIVSTAALELAAVRSIIDSNPYTRGTLAALPNNASYYKDQYNNVSQTYPVRSMSWLLYQDRPLLLKNLTRAQQVPFRYALVALFYALGGSNWIDSGGWLTNGGDICQWDGVICASINQVVALELSSNHLVGTLPNELALLTSLNALGLDHNRLMGTIPGDALGSLPALEILYLQNNLFVGPVPNNLNRNGKLQTLSIQQNNFNGTFPYCSSSGKPLLRTYTLDCKKLNCSCCTSVNC